MVEYCQICRTHLNLEKHHLKPLSRGGKDTPENTVYLCSPCHNLLGDHGYAKRNEGELNRSFAASFYLGAAYKKTWQNFRTICIREGTTASKKITEFITEYVLHHEPGNPQQTLPTIMKLGKAYKAPKQCGFKGCGESAFGFGVFLKTGKRHVLCKGHYQLAEINKQNWKAEK